LRRQRRIVLRGDQLEVLPLVPELADDPARDLRRDRADRVERGIEGGGGGVDRPPAEPVEVADQ
jgi:hypothetical protein